MSSQQCWCSNKVDSKDASLCNGCNSYQGDCDCITELSKANHILNCSTCASIGWSNCKVYRETLDRDCLT